MRLPCAETAELRGRLTLQELARTLSVELGRVNNAESEAETRLAVVERITAGRAPAHARAARAAVRIITRATMPGGADTVLKKEDVRV